MTSLPTAEVLVGTTSFDDTLAFFTDTVGLRLDRISPADDPAVAIVSGHGITLRIDRTVAPMPLALRMPRGIAPLLTGPHGITVESVSAEAADMHIPELVSELVISHAGDESNWVIGRAGMRYRDLIPSRLGGRYIASHIEVCDGGPVPDLVHHHAIRFQMIFCHRGWVDVVYEDQGPPFRLTAGDCVLQPAHIRHRVLESSAGAQVVEIGCPAEHDTFFDYDLALPTATVDPGRDFGGQTFVRHQADLAPWVPSDHPGFEVQHTAIEAATKDLACVRVVRRGDGPGDATVALPHQDDFWFLFVLAGSASFVIDDAAPIALVVGDSVAIPAGHPWNLVDASTDLEVLEVVVR